MFRQRRQQHGKTPRWEGARGVWGTERAPWYLDHREPKGNSHKAKEASEGLEAT